MSDQPDAETSTKQRATFTTDNQLCTRRDSNPQSEQVSSHSPAPFTLVTTANKTESKDVCNCVNENSECQGTQNVRKLCISVRNQPCHVTQFLPAST